MKLTRPLSCATLLAAAAGCGQAGPELVGQEAQGIYQGHASGIEDDGIVKLTNVDANGVTNSCTAALVAPNVVLTARHCVSNLIRGEFTCTDAGELSADSQGGRFGPLIDPANLKIYVGAAFKEPLAALGAKVFATQTPSICRNDVAAIVLDREISGVPLMPIRIDRGNERGEVLRVIGFGETEQAMSGVRRAKDGVTISLVGASQFRADGDPIPPRTFLTLGPALCIGDSGGPALTRNGAVTGIYSQLVGACDSLNARQYFTQVAPFAGEVVTPAFELAGYEPITEGATTSDGGAGGDDSGAGGAENAGAASTSAGRSEPGSAGLAGAKAYQGPPDKGGCACSTSALPRAGLLGRLATALMFGAAAGGVSRRRRRDCKRAP
jgi:hypothetical protein